MLRVPSRVTTSRDRIANDSGLEDSVLARWFAQLTVGGLPGVLVCLVIMWMVGKPSGEGSGTHIASMVPLLSANGLSDSPAFHRLGRGAAHAAQYRIPDAAADGAPHSNTPPLASLDSGGSRTAWLHLTADLRLAIDAGLARHPNRGCVVLHGSGTAGGNARLLDRYQTTVRSQGEAYHFVIGNGSGAPDGAIEAGRRWASSDSGADIQVCLVGDFSEHPASKAQLAALRELLDYLSIKLGHIELAAPFSPGMAE